MLIPCMECLKELGKPTEWLGHAEFRDDGRYEVDCPRGHTTVTLLQEEKYEILFEIGVNAILDGYYREAVASFAAALERFYESAVTVLLEGAGVSREHVLSTWKLVSAQSERQLGAFIFLWLSRFNEAPEVLDKRSTELRNDVVHKGKIPSKEQAISFGDAVLRVILPKVARMSADLPESMAKATFYTLKERSSGGKNESQTSTMSIRTAFRRAKASEAGLTVASYLAEVAEARAVIQASGV